MGEKPKKKMDWRYLVVALFGLVLLAKFLGGSDTQAAFIAQQQVSGGVNLCLIVCMLLVPSVLVGGAFFANKKGFINVPFLPNADASGNDSTESDAGADDGDIESPPKNATSRQAMAKKRSTGQHAPPPSDGIPTWLWIVAAILILFVIGCLGAMFFLFGNSEEDEYSVKPD